MEELQTTSEELQSSDEEMETISEELQSANAELQAMNEGLRDRTRDLDRANAFLESIPVSVDVGVVAIESDFDIALWNERAEEAQGHSLLDLDSGLPVEELKEPIERFPAGDTEGGQLVLDATNRRGQGITCHVSRTIRRGSGGEPEGVVLLMEAERR